MKCKKCNKQMKTIPGKTTIDIDNALVEIVNIPVFVCPECDERIISNIAIGRANDYARQYGAPNNRVDFAACENRESAEAVIVMQTLGIL